MLLPQNSTENERDESTCIDEWPSPATPRIGYPAPDECHANEDTGSDKRHYNATSARV